MYKESGANRQTKTIELSSDNIGLPTPKNRNGSSSLYHENRYMRNQNDVLKKELQSISLKLDEEIKKRVESNKKRPWSKDAEDVSYLELQNAYKKCEIYKKQANFYRKRFSSLQDESKYEQFDTKINEYQKQNSELKNQIKSLKKAIKLQQKGLVEMGTQEYTRIAKENQQLKQQNRRLKKYLSQYRLASLKSRQSNKSEETPSQDKKKSGENDLNNDDPHSMREKLEKNYLKTKILNSQISHLRDLLENYKLQIQEKDKQVNLYRQRVANLRKNNEQLRSRRNTKRQQHSSRQSVEGEQNRNGSSSNSRPSKAKTFKTEPIQSRVVNYPIKVEKGKGTHSSTKWSDQAFSSKIKEVQVLLNQKGQIKDIHIRYEKGEPKKYSQSSLKMKSNILSCSENEYIFSMSGIFVNNYLKFLTLKTNSKRGQSFGIEIQENKDYHAQIFNFQAKQSQFIGALFGQKDSTGITKIGCFIMKI